MNIAHIAPTANSNISAAWRTRLAQEKLGLNAYALVHVGNGSEHVKLFRSDNTCAKRSRKLFSRIDTLPLSFCRKRDRDLPFSTGVYGYKTSNRINELKPDIAHFHWLTSGFMNLQDLSQIHAPVVLTLHDVWGVTAGCHCNLGCDLWKSGCRNCPQLKDSIFGWDTSHLLWKRKRDAFQKIKNLTVISPSQWLGNMVTSSELFSRAKQVVIPNCLNTEIFAPKNKQEAKQRLGLPLDKKIILFAAVGATRVSYKGFDLLKSALELMHQSQPDSFHLLVFGATESDTPLPYSATFLGNLNQETDIAMAYNAADVFVTPSRQDNLPNTLLEASACGIPSVGFNIGGIPEIIQHQATGYIAQAFEVQDLVTGINWVLELKDRTNVLSKNAREFAVSNYDANLIAKKHFELYQSLV